MHFKGCNIFSYVSSSTKHDKLYHVYNTPLIKNNKEAFEVYGSAEKKLEARIYNDIFQISLYIYLPKYTEFIVLERHNLKNWDIMVEERSITFILNSDAKEQKVPYIEKYKITFYSRDNLILILNEIKIKERSLKVFLDKFKSIIGIKKLSSDYIYNIKNYNIFLKAFKDLIN